MIDDHDVDETTQPIGIYHAPGSNGPDGATFGRLQHNTTLQAAIGPLCAKTSQGTAAGYRIGSTLAQPLETTRRLGAHGGGCAGGRFRLGSGQLLGAGLGP